MHSPYDPEAVGRNPDTAAPEPRLVHFIGRAVLDAGTDVLLRQLDAIAANNPGVTIMDAVSVSSDRRYLVAPYMHRHLLEDLPDGGANVTKALVRDHFGEIRQIHTSLTEPRTIATGGGRDITISTSAHEGLVVARLLKEQRIVADNLPDSIPRHRRRGGSTDVRIAEVSLATVGVRRPLAERGIMTNAQYFAGRRIVLGIPEVFAIEARGRR